MRVFEDCGWSCASCNISTPIELKGSIDDRAPELDHIVPLSRGGDHVRANVRLLCRLCNRLKGNKLDSEWIPVAPLSISTEFENKKTAAPSFLRTGKTRVFRPNG